MKDPQPSAPRKPRRPIPSQVLDQLRQYILNEGLQPGDRLPTERQLAQDLGFSRNSVREALTSLESVGAVSRRPKIGCVLQPIDLSTLGQLVQFQMLRDTQDLAELFIARRLLEESILPLAAANATEEDFLTLEANVKEMEKKLAEDDHVHDLDEAFHRGLFAAAHNNFLFQFGSLIQVFFRESRRQIRYTNQVNNTVVEHRAILAALRKRDAAAAKAKMHEHLGSYLRSGTIKLSPAVAKAMS